MRKMLMPIRPDWVEKILSGEKTVELRKRLPDLEKLNWKEPFQVIVYCSQRRKLWTAEHGNIAGKVVAEFTCDKIKRVYDKDRRKINREAIEEACVSIQQLEEYAQGAAVFGYHISNVQVYERPREISEYGIRRVPQTWVYVEDY